MTIVNYIKHVIPDIPEYTPEPRLKNLGMPLWSGATTEDLFTITAQSGSYTTERLNDGGLRIRGSSNDAYINILMALPYDVLVNSCVVDCIAPSTQNIVSVYFGTGSNLSPLISKSFNVSGAVATHRTGLRQKLWFSGGSSAAWSNGSALNLDTYVFNYFRIRVTPNSGEAADFTLYGVKLNPAGKSRIAVVSDDGYKGWIKYGVPIFARRSIPSSIGVIPNLVGGQSYATQQMLEDFVSSGNECIAHGPATGGTLYSDFNNDHDRLQDILDTRTWLEDNDLAGDQQLKCYIYPGGLFQTSPGDNGLLDLMYREGITLGRTVTRFMGFSGDELLVDPSASKYAALTLPIIGYIRPTTNEAADTTELANTTGAIQYCAQNGIDGIVMLHDVIAPQGVWAATASTDITADKLVTIADKLVEARDTYGAELVLLSSFAS